MTGHFWDWRHLRRVLLMALGCAVPVLAAIFLFPWLGVYVATYRTSRTAILLLVGLEIAYGVVLAASLTGIVVLGAIVFRARRRRMPRQRAARALLLCGATTLALALAEASAAAWCASIHRIGSLSPNVPMVLPARVADLPTEFAEIGDDSDVTIVVLGESSAYGVPFHTRFSVGPIVAWKLGEVIPNRRFRAVVLASPAETLEGQYRKLAGLIRRPDALIVYCGHNEFDARVPWTRRVNYYQQAEKHSFPRRIEELASLVSPLCRLIEEAADEYRVEAVLVGYFRPPLVDVPAYTPEELATGLANFHRLLEAITSYAERVGAVPVLVVPLANDAGFDPNRSFLAAETSLAEREAFARDFSTARSLESSDREGAIKQYRDLLARQPGFAESHYRLARLLSDAGAWDEAYHHYVAARDLDGMPMRCLTSFQQVYRDVAARHDCALVDGQELFHAIGVHGLLNDDLFIDAMHPVIRGHVALASAILDALHARQSFGWPSDVPTPAIDPAQCVAHFGFRSQDWKSVCDEGARFSGGVAVLRHDPSQRFARQRALEAAIRRMDAGEPPEALGVRGIACGGPATAGAGANRISLT